MRISDWSSDVCSSDLKGRIAKPFVEQSKHRAETLQAGRRDVLLPRLAHGETPRPENRTKSDMDRAREKREPFERASALHPRNRQEARSGNLFGDIGQDRNILGEYDVADLECGRSEERRVGEEWVSTCRSRCWPDH